MPRLFLRIFATYWLSLILTIIVWKLALPPGQNGASDAWFFGSHIAAAILISGAACLLATHYITRPIRALRAAARAIAEGNLTARAGAPGRERTPQDDELPSLVRDFNHMAARLEAFVHSQERVVRDVSHELRAPLARLGLAVDLLGQSAEDTAEQRQRMQRDLQRLQAIVDRFLLVLRLDAETQVPIREWFDLEDLVAQVLEEASTEATSRGSKLIAMHVEQCAVEGDFELLRSAIENVVRNAILHTDPGTHVTVSVTGAGPDGFARVVVEDDGPGVPPDELGSLFHPFYRLDHSQARRTQGFGLGLTIAQRVVSLHGGTIVARNREMARGLSVEIRIPLPGHSDSG